MCLGKKCSQVKEGDVFTFRRSGYRTKVKATGRGKKTVPVEVVNKRHDDPNWVKETDWQINASPVELTPA